SSSVARASLARRAWGRLPGGVRRPIVWLMRSDRVRLRLLGKLGIRPEAGFITLSPGGLVAIEAAMKHLAADGPQGDYFEFGLYRGYTLWYAQQAADRHQLATMRFYGFDSFSGLPEVEGNDRRAGLFFSGDYRCTRREVEDLLTEHGFDWSRAK